MRSTMLEPRTEPPFVEFYDGGALPWAGTRAQRHHEILPAMNDWPQLIGAHAEQNAAWAKEEFNP